MITRETMLFRIFIFFLLVVITQSEFRSGLWRTQESEYESRNNLSGYRRDYKLQENNFGDLTLKQQVNNFGDSTYNRQENNFGDSTYNRQENNFGDLIPKQQVNNFGDSTYKREENNFGGSIPKPQENYLGNLTFGQQENAFDNYTNKVEQNNFGDSTPKRGQNNSGNSPLTGGSTHEKKCGLDVPRRIIGGTTADLDEFPWLCLLEYVDPSGNVSYDCSGVLISKRYVLTAAHCTNGPGLKAREMKVRRVRLGEWDLSSDKDCQGDVCSGQLQEIDIEYVIPHENYKPGDKSQVNDIALIRLNREANLTQFVQPICLPSDKIGGADYKGKKLTVSGWGRTSNARDSSSTVKMKVELPVVDHDHCRRFYQSFYGNLRVAESQFCAGGEEGKDTCQGDSGGPLMTIERTNNEIKWYVIGIVSSGPAACGVQDRPSLYTNVSQYTNWITDNIKN